MIAALVIYSIPLVSIVPRLIIIWRYWSILQKIPGEETQARDVHRSVLQTVAAISFAGSLVILFAEPTLRQSLAFAAYLLLFSSLSNFFAFSLQGYKKKDWHDQIGDAAREAGTGCLCSAIAVSVAVGSFDMVFSSAIIVTAMGVWLTENYVRLRLSVNDLQRWESAYNEVRRRRNRTKTPETA